MTLLRGLTPALYGLAAGLVASVFAERLLKVVFPTHPQPISLLIYWWFQCFWRSPCWPPIFPRAAPRGWIRCKRSGTNRDFELLRQVGAGTVSAPVFSPTPESENLWPGPSMYASAALRPSELIFECVFLQRGSLRNVAVDRTPTLEAIPIFPCREWTIYLSPSLYGFFSEHDPRCERF